MADARTPRDNQTREKQVRPATWSQPSTLPDPNPREGYVHRWVRLSIFGQIDPSNMNVRMREGWTPVLASEYPEIENAITESERFSGNIVIGGLILCKAPVDVIAARDKAHRQMAASQLEAVDNSYLRESDPRMPMLRPERQTRVTYGPKSQD